MKPSGRLVLPRGNFSRPRPEGPAEAPQAAGPTEPAARWRDLVDRRLPEAARTRPAWAGEEQDFARILLDNACGGAWRESVPPPAWANLPPARLAAAIALGEALLDGGADLAALARRSRGWRAATRRRPAPESIEGGDIRLRRWRRSDDAPFAALNADPAVMAHFPALRGRAESLTEARALDRRFDQDGFGPWAVEAEGRFVGFAGGWRIPRAMPFRGGERPGAVVELGWRLAQEAWGRGIATRAARMALADLFQRCGIGAVVAYTARDNLPSQAVMRRLGMERDPAEDFAHPTLPPEHRLSIHVLYRLAAEDDPEETA